MSGLAVVPLVSVSRYRLLFIISVPDLEEKAKYNPGVNSAHSTQFMALVFPSITTSQPVVGSWLTLSSGPCVENNIVDWTCICYACTLIREEVPLLLVPC